MKKRDRQDRLAFIERLEKKHSETIRNQRLYKQQRFVQQSLRTVRGMRLSDGDLDYEVTDLTLHSGHRLAY